MCSRKCWFRLWTKQKKGRSECYCDIKKLRLLPPYHVIYLTMFKLHVYDPTENTRSWRQWFGRETSRISSAISIIIWHSFYHIQRTHTGFFLDLWYVFMAQKCRYTYTIYRINVHCGGEDLPSAHQSLLNSPSKSHCCFDHSRRHWHGNGYISAVSRLKHSVVFVKWNGLV